jgi:hypothetical protein
MAAARPDGGGPSLERARGRIEVKAGAARRDGPAWRRRSHCGVGKSTAAGPVSGRVWIGQAGREPSDVESEGRATSRCEKEGVRVGTREASAGRVGGVDCTGRDDRTGEVCSWQTGLRGQGRTKKLFS